MPDTEIEVIPLASQIPENPLPTQPSIPLQLTTAAPSCVYTLVLLPLTEMEAIPSRVDDVIGSPVSALQVQFSVEQYSCLLSVQPQPHAFEMVECVTGLGEK